MSDIHFYKNESSDKILLNKMALQYLTDIQFLRLAYEEKLEDVNFNPTDKEIDAMHYTAYCISDGNIQERERITEWIREKRGENNMPTWGPNNYAKSELFANWTQMMIYRGKWIYSQDLSEEDIQTAPIQPMTTKQVDSQTTVPQRSMSQQKEPQRSMPQQKDAIRSPSEHIDPSVETPDALVEDQPAHESPESPQLFSGHKR